MAVGLLAAPIIARLYDPDSFGVFSILNTLVVILGACTSLSYETAMPLADSISRRRALFVLVCLITLSGTALLTVAAWFAGEWAAGAYGKPRLAKYAMFVPLLFLAGGASRLIGMTLSCQKQFGKVAVREVVRRTAMITVQITGGLVGLAKSPPGLLLGALGGGVAGALAYSTTSVKSLFLRPEEPFRIEHVRAVAVQYKRFPLIQFWSQTFNAMTVGLPVLVMGFLFEEMIVGFYGFARQLLVLPVVMFTASGSQVFYVDAAESTAQGNSVAPAARELFRLLVTLTALPLMIVLVLGPLLFEIVLGSTWREAGVYAQILVPWIALTAIGSPLSAMLLAKNKLGENFLYNVVLLIARLSALVAGGLLVGPRTALGLFVGASVLVWGHLLARTLQLAGVRRIWGALTLARSYGEALLLLAPAGILFWCLNMEIGALVALGVAGGAEAALLWMRHPKVRGVLSTVFLRRTPSAGRPPKS